MMRRYFALSCFLLHGTFANLISRATNADGSTPVYKIATAAVEDRVKDLLPRMTLEEKVAQLIQGDINGWMNTTDPLDNTLTFNQTGLEEMIRLKGGSIWAGYAMPWEKFVFAIETGQRYLMENTTLGIPALFQSEGLHGFTNNGTIFPSPIGLAASFNRDLVQNVSTVVANEAEGFGITHIFAPVLDLSRELRWGRVEENFGEDPYLTGEIGLAFVRGLQDGTRRGVESGQGRKRVAATCKHFAAFGSPQGGLNLAPVAGGERELRTTYDGVPAIADKHMMTDILREEWGYPYWVTTDAGSADLLITLHGTCETRECAAKTTLENSLSGEMGGGTYTYLTLVDQVKAGLVDESVIDQVVSTLLRVKFELGLFENPYPYDDYASTIRTSGARDVLHQSELESIVLLENHDNVLPLSTDIGSVALIGPQAGVVTFGDYVFFNASNNGISPLTGFQEYLSSISSATQINYAEGCKRWSNDESGFDETVSAAEASDAAVVMVGTWSLDQTLLWTPGTNATTGEHVDLSNLALVGAQLKLVQAIKATGKPTIVVFVSGKPVTEPWIQAHADAVIQQFYPGELGGLAIAEIIFGAENPSGKLPVSFPRDVGTAPAFYNYLKGARPVDPGSVLDDGTLVFGHQYVLNSPVPLWGFGHGLSYATFNYTDLTLSQSNIGTGDDFNVTVTVHNNGAVDGKEVVQMYITDTFSSVVTPNQRLAGFSKVDVPAGSSQTVTIPISSSQLAVWSYNGWVVEPGTFNVKIGTSEETYINATLTVQ
ncbi:glycoside hydrolase family 3 protein [Desarmillaria tabescens]|uniref:Glycoside hydrolase family 3 protein n=1 Tax=Armillaria tabescens TaxID=1929756 RepID=A0AA39MY23_ARMTA|nr:glycoside hydrolase family 3 protein [Desarmillaria tabescens]KAK0451186.1 glycoside hydrolase family 3 protein [Desarmillaria tabescens]